MPKDYIIVKDIDAQSLATTVKAWMSQGYVVCGGVSITLCTVFNNEAVEPSHPHGRLSLLHAQAMQLNDPIVIPKYRVQNP